MSRPTFPMHKTWTDTHYKLDETDGLSIAKHEREKSATLTCSGQIREGVGFSIHFTPSHIEALEQLIQVLRDINSQQSPAPAPLFYPKGREI